LPIHSVRVVGTGDAQPIKRHMSMPLVVTPPHHQFPAGAPRRGVPPCTLALASAAISARSSASPSTCASGSPSPPTAATSMHEWPSPSPQPVHRAADARIIAPTPSSCTRSFHDLHPNTVMMGPWVPPPTSRALAPCQITSAIPVCPTHWSGLCTRRSRDRYLYLGQLG